MIAKALVDDPDSVAVSERQDGRTTVIEVRVADSDMGKVIGKQGRIAKSDPFCCKKQQRQRKIRKLLLISYSNLTKRGQALDQSSCPLSFSQRG